jgi:16S rRNA (guanine(966)-N(2))-methyltransferase RsmD
MKIISGKAKGRNIESPKGGVRPMRGVVRDSLFNILGSAFDFEGRSFLDLFAGTGAVGFEALSRGFAHADFVEISPKQCRLIQNNAKNLGFNPAEARVIKQNALYFIDAAHSKGHKWDVVFAGTPYIDEVVEKLLDSRDKLSDMLTPDGKAIIQLQSRYSPMPEDAEIRKYSGDTLLFYHR